VNGHGDSLSQLNQFSTLINPSVSADLASDIEKSSARLNGVVNARNFDALVAFEWGEDGSTFPNRLDAFPGSVTGNADVSVSVNVSGLHKGGTYYYRVLAANAGGTTVSGTQSFRTLTEPVPQIGGSFTLSTTSVRVEGSVDPEGSDSSVVFEYGTDGMDFPNSVSATQGTQIGFGSRPVSAVFTNLEQGVTYHYRIRATSEGGVGTSASASFAMNVLSGFNQVFPGSVPEADGLLLVNLAPSGIVHGWRFIGEQRWRNSGEAVTGLTVADRKIEFRPVPGYIHPPAETTDPISGDGTATVINREYFETEDTGSGGLSVTLKPDVITTGPDRARWRLQGQNDTMWRDSGETLLGLPPGGYSIECKPFTGRITPSIATVKIGDRQTAAPTITYFLAGTATGDPPSVLAFETVSTDETKPYAYVGQIRSQAGLGTGFAVKERVVATAAHVVWDEGTLSAAQDLQWLHQRHHGSYEPEALAPRGFYTLSGYDAQRRVENTPGSFSPQSRNRDVAALYFHGDDAARLGYAARGGFSGFLASDLDNNEFLLSDANKMLVGYPIDDVATGSQGRMHATAPFNVGFVPVAFTPADPGESKRVFLTTDIRSNGGASGGPICVQFEGGTYYPAAIYLGGTTQTLVRAIDSGVIGLFDLAALSGIDGQGHVGGGITHTDVTQIGGPSAPSKVTVILQPAAAAAAGGWRLKPENGFRASGDQRGGLNAGKYVLQLKTVPGYEAPASQNLVVPGGEHITHTFTYTPLLPEIDVRGNGLSIVDDDTSPSSLDHTDFGIVGITSGTRTRTYTIQNTGDGPLSVGTVAVGGSHPGDFTVNLQPGWSVPPGESTSFQVVFDPSADGTRYGNLSFSNGDSDENPYTFSIRGNAGEDQDNNGFTNAEEEDLGLLLSRLILGNSVDLDLSFLELGPGGSLVVLGLPPGMVFDPPSGRILGSISGTPGTFPIELQKLIGDEVVSSLALEMELAEPARLKLGTLRAFAATKVRKRSRPQSLSIGNIGGSPLSGLSTRSTGKAARDFVLTQPLTKTLDAGGTTTFTVSFKPRAKGSRRAGITIFSNTNPKTVPVSGRGK